jgi:hypothetical protein
MLNYEILCSSLVNWDDPIKNEAFVNSPQEEAERNRR